MVMVDANETIAQQMTRLRGQQADQLSAQTASLNQFYNSPDRQADIQAQTQPMLQRAIGDLQRSGQDQTRGLALQGAGNMGGSAQQQQLGRIAEGIQRQGMQVGAQHSQRTNHLQNLMAQQQTQALGQANQLNGFDNAGVGALNQAIGGQIQGQNQYFADQSRTNQLQQYHDAEQSRSYGNALGMIASGVKTHYDATGRGKVGFGGGA